MERSRKILRKIASVSQEVVTAANEYADRKDLFVVERAYFRKKRCRKYPSLASVSRVSFLLRFFQMAPHSAKEIQRIKDWLMGDGPRTCSVLRHVGSNGKVTPKRCVFKDFHGLDRQKDVSISYSRQTFGEFLRTYLTFKKTTSRAVRRTLALPWQRQLSATLPSDLLANSIARNSRNRARMIRFLVGNGFDVPARTQDFSLAVPHPSSLLAASVWGSMNNARMISFLTESGAIPLGHTSDRDPVIYIVLAAYGELRALETTKLLVAHGCDPFEASLHGDTPLHIALQQGHITVVHCLLSPGVPLPSDLLTTLNLWDMENRTRVLRELVDTIFCEDEALETLKHLVEHYALPLNEGTSSVVHEETHQPLLSILSSVVETVVHLRSLGHKVVLVSSGAIGPSFAYPDSAKALSAIGQGRLIALWDNLFGQFDQRTAQILLTRGDISERTRYLNEVNTIRELLSMGVVPIVNENDTISVSEIKFGDNDTLSAITSSMIHADYLFLLTDVDGLYTANPRKDPAATKIDVVMSVADIRAQVSTSTLGSSLGTGVETKLIAAEIATGAGVTTVITSSKKPSTIISESPDVVQC
ncbi:Aspartate/glutamate/uridylate kinase [Boletus edulis BED1]|uniref:Aspartate/glutamate/uridylate kinase n=1 Tax=Boletus edulis BED1 TaxID=1328754 RepID=A0AAD4BR45_BOLED|nr:Aspartate/glutamate/uridylate kinase [Boletus edulis BED1]